MIIPVFYFALIVTSRQIAPELTRNGDKITFLNIKIVLD